MKNWKKTLIPEHASIREAIESIDASATHIALLTRETGERNLLLGTVSDGDVRRAILGGVPLDAPARQIMNDRPTVAHLGDSRDEILGLMRAKRLQQIPVVDSDGCLVGIEILDDLLSLPQLDNLVVLMAGGLGSRLRPLTNRCPKPMLQIGGKPILENILDTFISQGFRRFCFCVNYMSEMITDYFEDGSHWGVEIKYVHEQKRLGTAGALSLLPESPGLPLLVMNGDLLTKVNFNQLLDFHSSHQANATMAVREYEFQVPYGVVDVDNFRIVGLEEKPTHRFFVNAGIYVLEPEILHRIPRDDYFDMPTLFDHLRSDGLQTAAFPLREYWIDIGQMDDFERANGEYGHIFQ